MVGNRERIPADPLVIVDKASALGADGWKFDPSLADRISAVRQIRELDMTDARIFRPAKNAMQSGHGNSRFWVIEYVPTDRMVPDPLMGWSGSRDTRTQLRLRFATKEEAVAYADRQGLTYTITEPPAAKPPRPKNYADNFRFERVE
jgi:hypothetical protein